MQTRMRLLFIADINTTNASVWLSYFANELGHDVHVIAMRPVRRTIAGVTVHDLGTNLKARYFARIPRIRRLVRTIGPDLLIAYRVQSHGFLAACSGFRPLALAGQCDTIAWPPDSPVRRLFCRYALRRADLISSWSEIMTANLVRLGARPEVISTYPRGVKTDVFFASSEPPPAPPYTLITTRGLATEYHQDAVMRSLSLVRRRFGSPLQYLVLGEGPMRGPLERLSVDLGLQDAISFLGLVPHAGVADHLRRSHVYVSLVSTEGVSASLLEAMACGVFPIVPDIPANRLWIEDGKNGFLVPMDRWRGDRARGFQAPPADGTALADQILAALRDETLRRRARAINSEIVRQKACWHSNMARMECAYRALVDRRLSRPRAVRDQRGAGEGRRWFSSSGKAAHVRDCGHRP
jgi:glycosyltransferase involved in cell wall biosynthesis